MRARELYSGYLYRVGGRRDIGFLGRLVSNKLYLWDWPRQRFVRVSGDEYPGPGSYPVGHVGYLFVATRDGRHPPVVLGSEVVSAQGPDGSRVVVSTSLRDIRPYVLPGSRPPRRRIADVIALRRS